MEVKLKVVIFLLSLCLLNILNSQTLDLGFCDADKISPAGLGKLKNVIGNARIVIIGEQTHGVGTDYESFTHMVKFLHEELGFDVIIQEHCLYTFGLVQESRAHGASSQAYRSGMYWPQGKAKENDLLFDYLDAQELANTPIVMEGFDSRFFQRESFLSYFDSLLNDADPLLLAIEEKEAQLMVLKNVLKYEYKDTLTNNKAKNLFLENMEIIIDNMNHQSYNPRTIQLMKNAKSFAKNAWGMEDLSIDDPDRFFERENQMAENIVWFAETMYPEDKIIIRLHNGHASKNIFLFDGILPDSLVKKTLNVGSQLHQKFGEQCLHIGTTYYSGTHCKWDYKSIDIPKPKSNSFESKLHRKGYKYAYVNLKAKGKFYMFHSEFNSWIENGFLKAPYGSMFDGMLFIDEGKMPNEKK